MRTLLLLVALAGCSAEPVPLDDPSEPPTTGSDPSVPPEPEEPVTWHRDVAPLVARRCVGCHQEGGIMADLELSFYDQAEPWAPMIAHLVETRRMPPFPADQSDACPQPWGFVGDRRLDPTEIDLVTSWVDAGAPEGDPADAVVVEPVPEAHLSRVDQVLEFPAPQEIPPAQVQADVTRCLLLDPERVGWLQGVEVVADNTAVVHHLSLSIVAREDAVEADRTDGVRDAAYPCDGANVPGSQITGYAPGTRPFVLPDDTAFEVGVGEVFVVQVHYHAIAEAQVDDTVIHLQWRADPPPFRAIVMRSHTATSAEEGLLPGPNDRYGVPEFFVPAGVTGHTEAIRWENEVPVDADHEVIAVLGHMHQVGVGFEARVTHADGSPGPCLLEIPRWDFAWQLLYLLDGTDHPKMRADDVITMTCTYDNTVDNPGVVKLMDEYGLDAPKDVVFGLSTDDEMCSMAFLIKAAR